YPSFIWTSTGFLLEILILSGILTCSLSAIKAHNNLPPNPYRFPIWPVIIWHTPLTDFTAGSVL
ncbi:MAG: hypothetical protein WCC12_06240, partial [Anaerolineales bacterium]